MKSIIIRTLIGLIMGFALAGCGAGAGFDMAVLSGMTRSDAPSHYGAYLAARQAQYDRDTEAAALHYRRALRTGPADSEILERAYVLEISNGNVGLAGPLAEAAVASNPENVFARLTAAVARFERGEYKKVRELIDGYGASGLTELTTGLLSAWAQFGAGDTAGAIDNLATREMRGVELFQSYHGALMADLAGLDGEAEVGYVAAITGSGGGSVRVVEAYGNFLERTNRSEQAVRIYDAYLELAPGHNEVIAARERAQAGRRARRMIPNAKAGAAEAMFSVASVVAGEGSFDIPSLYLRFALHLRPGHNEARILLGELFLRMGFEEQAVEIFAGVARNSALKFDADIRRAVILSSLDRQDEALELLANLTGSDPRSIEAWTSLADTLRGEERFEDAADAYAHAIGLLSVEEQSAPRYWALYYAYGIVLERTDNWEEAQVALEYALTLNEDHPYVLNYLGYSWIEQGINLDEALVMIHRAVDQRPRDGFIVDSLGWGYYQLGQFEEAVEYLELASELAPGDPTVNDHLGDAYWRLGMERQARFQWSHVLESDLEGVDVPSIENKIANGLGDRPQTAAGTTQINGAN